MTLDAVIQHLYDHKAHLDSCLSLPDLGNPSANVAANNSHGSQSRAHTELVGGSSRPNNRGPAHHSPQLRGGNGGRSNHGGSGCRQSAPLEGLLEMGVRLLSVRFAQRQDTQHLSASN